MRKTLIFRNIQQDQRRESWDQTKIILENKIKKKMENIDHGVIIRKIERASRAKENRTGRNLLIIAKFTDWNRSSERWKQLHPDLGLADVLTCINHAT